MAKFIELNVIISESDPHEKTAPKLFNKIFITDIEYDDNGHVWITYEGNKISCRGNYDKIRSELLID